MADSPQYHQCKTCRAHFSSRNRLFLHLDQAKHKVQKLQKVKRIVQITPPATPSGTPINSPITPLYPFKLPITPPLTSPYTSEPPSTPPFTPPRTLKRSSTSLRPLLLPQIVLANRPTPPIPLRIYRIHTRPEPVKPPLPRLTADLGKELWKGILGHLEQWHG